MLLHTRPEQGSNHGGRANAYGEGVGPCSVLAGGPGIQKSASMAGHLMVYTSCVAGNCDVLALDLATGKVTPIAAQPWNEQQPDTDGQRVVWQDGRSTPAPAQTKAPTISLNDFDIYGANLDDLKPYQLTGAKTRAEPPCRVGQYSGLGRFP